jgi:hypothetical protein
MDLQTKTFRLFDLYPDIAREYAQKLHKKKEDIPFIQKFYASDKAENVADERAIVSYISTADIDRDSEILLPKGIQTSHYEKSGKPVFWGHQYGEPKDVIGQCLWVKADPSGNSIVAKTAFRKNEFSEEVYQLYTDELVPGHGPILRGWSVGFIPLEWDEGDKKSGARRTFTKWELLEYSAVSIPCNPQAQTIVGQKGLKLSDRLKRDLGLMPAVVEPDAQPDTASVSEPIIEIPVIVDSIAVGAAGNGGSSSGTGEVPATSPEIKYFDADGNEIIPELKAEGQPIDATLQLLTALLNGIADVRMDVQSVVMAISALRDSIPLLIMPAMPAPMPMMEGEPIELPATWRDLRSAVTELTARIESIKVSPVASVSAIAETAPVIETPAPIPEPVKSMTADELKAAVLETVKGLDIAAIVRSETTLALSKLKGKIEG